ncbi:MAG: Ppx/GppA phosphatase family protein [Balneolaceae bacterium]|nr:Ppx/GppA phosphatase family protein [Balneolaceae bacterium]
MISASIDIGTNTVLLLVAEIEKGNIFPLVEKQRIPRLGKGVDKEKNLHPKSIQRVLDYLLEFKTFLEDNYPDIADNTIVTATSAVRDASNRMEFQKLVKQKTGWSIQILSGSEEAEITYKGALSVLTDRTNKSNLILDIGGGSTELAFGNGLELKNAVSMNMGSVRFTERFFDNNPPNQEQILKAVFEIRRLLKDQNKPDGEFDLIGVAGTVTAIAAIDLDLKDYKVDRLNGYHLKRSSVERFIDEFSNKTWQETEEKYPRFLKGRGEVVLAGILILREAMDWCGKDSIITSTGGIRHGILISKSNKKYP